MELRIAERSRAEAQEALESTGKRNTKAASPIHAESSDLVPNIDAHTWANRSLGEQSERLEAVSFRSDHQFSHPQASREFEPSLKTKTVLRCCPLPDGVRQEYASQSGDASGFPKQLKAEMSADHADAQLKDEMSADPNDAQMTVKRSLEEQSVLASAATLRLCAEFKQQHVQQEVDHDVFTM